MYSVQTKFIVRYAETDQMQIVHHSNYPIWYEVGRTDFIKSLGIPYSEMEKNGIMIPLIDLKSTYKGAARYEDDITVKTSIKTFTATRITFYYEVINTEQKIINFGETTHAFTNSELKPVNLKKYAHNIYSLMEKACD